VGDVLDKAFQYSQAALVFLTGDDLARLGTRYQSPNDPPEEKQLMPQPRPNVLFELGMAFGRYPDRTVIVSLGYTRQFSDIVGRHVVRLTNTVPTRKKLVGRLKTAGCPVNIDHKDEWMTIGDSDAPAQQPDLSGSAALKIIRRRAHPEDTAQFKPKVWVEIRNDSGTCLEVRHMGWEHAPMGIQIKYGPASMQLKLEKVFCPEKEGLEHLHVPPDHTIRAWVQPTMQHDITDLEQRCQTEGRIGVLHLRVNGQDVKLTV